MSTEKEQKRPRGRPRKSTSRSSAAARKEQDKEFLEKLNTAQDAILELVKNEDRTKVRAIFLDARRAKRLDARALLVLLEDLGFTPEDTDRVYDILENIGVDVAQPDTWTSIQQEQDDAEVDPTQNADDSEEDRVHRASQAELDYLNPENPVQMYLREIGYVKLLTAEEEVELGKIMEAGQAAKDAIKDLRLDGVYSGEEYERLLAISRKGDQAKNHMVEANLRLVVSIAKHYSGPGMQFLDLIQEGNLGLLKAVDRFDYKRGFRFSTYASWWIRQSITRAISEHGRMIRVPAHMLEALSRVLRTSRAMAQSLGRDPSPEELAEALNMTVGQVTNVLRIAQDPISLETPVGSDEDAHLGDFIRDEAAEAPDEAAIRSLLQDHLDEALLTLTPREEEVLRSRYGIDNEATKSYEEIGLALNVTTERARQIEARALRKLRDPLRSKHLKDYI